MLPIKTYDIVERGGQIYVVRSVNLTADGPILDLMPVRMAGITMHASEVKLLDSGEEARRVKAITEGELP